ncbi:MgtC/SapB family protein [Pseudomonas sp. BN415]|uniref:MgtC/SapB family protein n=1 Tax=Pseudomonas sp. BN415 TaxID=2567889 RepID=UPI002453B532|nr:MgtC/SapB family protein [Pseudomonas sp. BN415]MDH4585128.1 MgtC/SapB family protein [Pseudomonas sp. BN415]
MPEATDVLLDFASALAVGLLIGAERGWRERNKEALRLVAGIRSFGLTGLLGGFAAFLGEQFGTAVWVAIFACFAVLVIASYFGELVYVGDLGLSSELTLLITFLLGSLAVSGYHTLSASGAVVVALLLSLKDELHKALFRLQETELSAALKLLFISVVMLPVLPNKGYGPWEVFNPYATWWMVVLIAALGFAAYFAIRLVGTQRGLLLTALLGGTVSSTAMTITLSHLTGHKSLRPLLAAGLLATSALMFPRVLLEVGLVNPTLLSRLGWPLGIAALVYAAGAFFYWRMAAEDESPNAEPPLKNPFELGPALRFAALLALILFLVEAARRYLGDMGVYLVSLLSGLTDVDAITLSLAGGANRELGAEVAVRGIFLAVLSNSLVKAGLIAVIGGKGLALRTFPFIGGGLLAGTVVLLMV